MNTTEIKKALCKETPMAEQLYNEDNNVIYGCDTSLGRVLFCIPIREASEFKKKKEQAQLLIRWLYIS
jgi:hypothetical protein